jgi:integrase
MPSRHSRRSPGEGSFAWIPSRQLYRARVPNPDNPEKPFQKTGKNRKEVKAWWDATRAAIYQGLPPEPSRSETLAEFLPRWLELKRPSIKPRTFVSYAQLAHNHLLHAEHGLGAHQLRQLTPERVQAFVNERKASGLSGGTVLNIRAVLRKALGDAKRWGLVSRNVADRDYIEQPRVVRKDIRPFTPEQAGHFVAAALGERYEHLYVVLLNTALRLGEAQALRWRDVDIEGGWLRVEFALESLPRQPWRLADPKSATSKRLVPLVEPARAALRAQHDRQAFERRQLGESYADNDFVFALLTGEPFTASTADGDFKKILARAGLDHGHRPHDLRHSCATWLTAAGVPERVIQQILGHSNPAMTRRYQHVLTDMLSDAAGKFDTWLATQRARPTLGEKKVT